MGTHCFIMKLVVSIATLLAVCNCRIIDVSDDVTSFMTRLCYDKAGGRRFVLCDEDDKAADDGIKGKLSKDVPTSDSARGRLSPALFDMKKSDAYENEAQARSKRSPIGPNKSYAGKHGGVLGGMVGAGVGAGGLLPIHGLDEG